MEYSPRLERLRTRMDEQGIPALLVTHLPDVFYLCGFTGSNAVVAITPKRAVLYTDGRYTIQAKAEAQALRVVIAKKPALLAALHDLVSAGTPAVFFDGDTTTVSTLAAMRSSLASGKQKPGKLLRPLKRALVAGLRMVKDADELERMQAAATLGDTLFEKILPHIQPDVSEIEIAARLENAARMAGAEAMSFPTIVASGPRSALPHGTASTARVPRRGFVTIDFGVILMGYCSDMTRTVHVGKATAAERSAYDAVLEAQLQGVQAVADGVTCGTVDHACRSVLNRSRVNGEKLGKFFTHSTGHGVGLEIHEQPRIARGQPAKLKAGMVITVEPGVYLPGRFGIRIEDTVVVQQAHHGNGPTILTRASKAWVEL